MTPDLRDPVIVELDAMSGQPNPRWSLDPAERAELARRWARAPQLVGAASVDEPLGYRGLVLRGGGDLEPLGVVFDGVLRLAAPGAARADPGRALERWLLATAGDRVDAALLRYVGQLVSGA
jgi:hypothetical protein